ncbi:flavodoxin [Caulobacter hibisci]|uniref:flavodoxin n=1 Tax=Caulobacter hibisci TaxID=2035993 RepID=UPI0018E3D18B|nr:hypothetical protein [Caulobacter hibisci]
MSVLPVEMSRRTALAAPAAMVLAAGASACAAEDRNTAASGSRLLVAYFTRSGNTRVIAGQLHRDLKADLKADLFEIQPARPYPEDYEQTRRAGAPGARRRRPSAAEGDRAQLRRL